MPSPNGSEHVLSSSGEENDAKEHLERGHCINKASVHDDNSLDRRNGRMRFSDFHGFLRLLPLPVFSFPQGYSLRSRYLECMMQDDLETQMTIVLESEKKESAPLRVQRGIKKATAMKERDKAIDWRKESNQPDTFGSEASKPVEEESPNAIPKLKSALEKSPDDENGSIDSITKADNAINKKYC
ncbi:hypothetical protein RHSIM_Rhsim06G0147400 [Rhododendron simsii]|uniref:Uncharacterized protein n=1 Tax=Rhododendron simsii TaxID=118357 RepID=A0A834GW38_RHOSS|nr:hypothetical protein RHSIM_Rhsim06G0147400 [Rhododendron simsii]